MQITHELVPLLVVRGAVEAIDFYQRALGAQVLARYEHGRRSRGDTPQPGRHVSHADLAAGELRFSVTEEARAWNSDAPPSLGGSPVVLQWLVDDAEAAVAAFVAAGATIVFPLGELLGERMSRVRDPFGHLWLVRQQLEALSTEEIQRRRDALFAAAEEESRLRNPPAPAQGARIHLVLGPVGAGKSTYATRLAREQNAVRLTLDAWMALLFRPDRPDEGVVPWYVERAARCVEQIWDTAQAIAQAGVAVILEIGLLRRAERADFFERVEAAGLELTLHLLDAPREVRRERVLARNRSGGPTFSMVVPPEIFELASDLWEPLDPDEIRDRDVRPAGI
jgi:uncharacterized glyoxalase superfamily protein PhnB/predicted kinase